MALNKFDQIVGKMVDGDFVESSNQLTKEEIEFLQQNPHLLAKISDSSFIKKKYIFKLFGISVVMAIVAKIIEYSQGLQNYPILNNLSTEVLFAIAMEMLGATIIAYFLEITLEQRVQKNQKIAEEIVEAVNRKKNQEATK